MLRAATLLTVSILAVLANAGPAAAEWMESHKLTASDAAAEDLFGSSVGISGNTALVGATGNDDAGSKSGSAYIFAPEPSSLWLLAIAAPALVSYPWRRRRS